MAKGKVGTKSTRERLLRSATELFVEKGFRDATVAEICERADANIAAVNYHFGDKERLYTEAWRFAAHDAFALHPPDGGVPAEAPAEERLRGRVLALLERLADDRDFTSQIMHREIAHPTGLLDEVKRDVLRPLHDDTVAIVRELVGDGPTDQEVELAEMSVISQCMHVMMRKRVAPPPVLRELHAPGGIRRLAEHIMLFSLAGLRAVAERANARQRHG